jgi:glutamate synthase (NADPH/NADH) large chain/glutamate synthase (ferredoxin)
MKTGLDIIMGGLLGAEEFNFGTAALIAAGCAMFRVCHLNTCPVGVATQRHDLRLKFRGKPENVVAFFDAVAEEVRELMASLGIRKFNDLVGRTDLLEVRSAEQFDESIRSKVAALNLDRLLWQADDSGSVSRIHTRERNERFGDSSLDDRIVNDAKHALQGKGSVKLNYKINNICRNIGTRVSGIIGYTYGDSGLPDGSVDLTLTGSAGQSFGTFLAKGIVLRLLGEANDYVGKGMNGGEIVVRPQDGVSFDWSKNVIIGNTCLYGATGGRLFAAGSAGERFGVRNSGSISVVEGVGDHGCEYMTGGVAVVLGETGRNFAAGMSGGMAYVYDENGKFPNRYNQSMVDIERLSDSEDIEMLKQLVQDHLDRTTSPKAAALLQHWEAEVANFWKVVPHPPEAKPASKPVHELNPDKPEPAPSGSF